MFLFGANDTNKVSIGQLNREELFQPSQRPNSSLLQAEDNSVKGHL